MKNLLLFTFVLVLFFSCEDEKDTAQSLIDETIEISGGEAYNNLDIEFDFRNRHYRLKKDNGLYQFERHFNDSTNLVKDILDNEGFKRYINDTLVRVEDSMAVKYTSSINSVQYFALLPSGLNDTAVNKKYLGTEKIKERTYHKIEITFDQEGGGEDYEDVFIYWLNSKSLKIEYIAYSYNESDGIGMRFREAYNERYVGSIRFIDYNNYKSNETDISLENLGKSFEAGELHLLSKIENTNIIAN